MDEWKENKQPEQNCSWVLHAGSHGSWDVVTLQQITVFKKLAVRVFKFQDIVYSSYANVNLQL